MNTCRTYSHGIPTGPAYDGYVGTESENDMAHKQPGLDGRHRDNDGEIHKKRGDTQLGTLRKEYGQDLLKGTRSDTRLDTILERKGLNSLDQLLRKEHKK